jgi:hypothetical protein
MKRGLLGAALSLLLAAATPTSSAAATIDAWPTEIDCESGYLRYDATVTDALSASQDSYRGEEACA